MRRTDRGRSAGHARLMLGLVHDVLRSVTAEVELPDRPGRVICLDACAGRVDGYVYLVFGTSGPTPLLVVKAARTELGKVPVATELGNLRALQARGINAGRIRVPVPLGAREQGPWLIAVQTAIPGRPMKNVPLRRLLPPGREGATVDRVLEWWREFARTVGVRRVRLDDAAYRRLVLQPVREFLARFRTTPVERALLEERFVSQARLLGRELPLTVSHGDFCPANMILAADGVVVFDWEMPLEHAPPLFDLFHFFASTRLPARGPAGESSHFDSFLWTYWGDAPFPRLARDRLRAAADELGVDRAVLSDLFLLALVRMANLKYEKHLAMAGGPEAAAEEDDSWETLGAEDKDVPFARVAGGAFLNLRAVAERGLPAL